MIKSIDSYVGYVIDHTLGSCCQRRSPCSEKRITLEKLTKNKMHPILVDAAKYLNQEA